MKKIVAYKCDFCDRYRISRSHLKEHENRCFKNPKSKSCIACKHLTQKMFLEGRLLTEEEHKIKSFQVEGTYYEMNAGWDDQSASIALNDEYTYLYDAEPETYCDAVKTILTKLRTNCNYYETNNTNRTTIENTAQV